jgi:hypothetical protein
MTGRVKWALVGLGVAGAILNACGLRVSFLVWIVANAGLLSLNLVGRRWPEAVLFGIYLATALFGWLQWGGLSA